MSSHAAPSRWQRRNDRVLTALEYTGWAPVAWVIGVVSVMALAGVTWIAAPPWGQNAQAQARNVGTVPTTPTRTVADVVDPNRIVIPKLHAKAPIVPVGTTPAGQLQVPLNPHHVGWWHYGAKPGATTGTAILAGHINYGGVTGAMAKIGRLDPGDRVDVFGRQNAQARHEVRFTVTGVRTYHKTSLPYKSIFDQQGTGRIAIVTCGGPFDAATGNYRDNIVVFAVPGSS